MGENKVRTGKFIRLLRLLNGLHQSDLADYLGTSQSIVAQLENNRYKPNPRYIHILSRLLFLNPEFLSDLLPPVFSRKLTIFTIRGEKTSSTKLLNQIDQATRKDFPSLYKAEDIGQVYAWTTGHMHNWSKIDRVSIFIFYSANLDQMILVKIIEDYKDQFFNAFIHVCNNLLIEYHIDDLDYGEVGSFISEDLPPFLEDQISEFREILSWTEIPNPETYIAEYEHFEANEIIFGRKMDEVERDNEDYFTTQSEVIKSIIGIMDKHDITVQDLAQYLKRNKK